MDELDPRFMRSSVKGIPSFWAISFTFSYDALASASDVDFWDALTAFATGAAFGATTAGAGAGVATVGGAAAYCLCLAKTLAIIDETADEPVLAATEV